ncbi:hypothetical protein NDU88_000150 [Pleurodeles waltl]|uniref:Uncharacterized protein n=1 Tax=Pleurodeles waltl TaxID=8319 RepID=A0AAV7TE71_PLEWA|nr:hypothetical protein NDU88_000150 [Pleurodeles waltl]
MGGPVSRLHIVLPVFTVTALHLHTGGLSSGRTQLLQGRPGGRGHPPKSSGARLHLPLLGDSPCWEGAGPAQPRRPALTLCCFTCARWCHLSSPTARPHSARSEPPPCPPQPGAEPPAGLVVTPPPVSAPAAGPAKSGQPGPRVSGNGSPLTAASVCFSMQLRPRVRRGQAHVAPKPRSSGSLVSSI